MLIRPCRACLCLRSRGGIGGSCLPGENHATVSATAETLGGPPMANTLAYLAVAGLGQCGFCCCVLGCRPDGAMHCAMWDGAGARAQSNPTVCPPFWHPARNLSVISWRACLPKGRWSVVPARFAFIVVGRATATTTKHYHHRRLTSSRACWNSECRIAQNSSRARD